VLKCKGSIVEGAEAGTLERHVLGLLPHEPLIVLDFGDVTFLDSRGLGLLVRLLARCRSSRGDLKLSAVSPRMREILKITRLDTSLEAHETEGSAVAAFYERSTSSEHWNFNTQILCVDLSADVLAYVGALLRNAGYGVVTSTNVHDALILLRAARPAVVVAGAAVRELKGTHSADEFNRLADAGAMIDLPASFSTDEAGEAGRQLLERVRATLPV
jgi:anti-anti-sigma factor